MILLETKSASNWMTSNQIYVALYTNIYVLRSIIIGKRAQ
jgi:hypothetical protein